MAAVSSSPTPAPSIPWPTSHAATVPRSVATDPCRRRAVSVLVELPGQSPRPPSSPSPGAAVVKPSPSSGATIPRLSPSPASARRTDPAAVRGHPAADLAHPAVAYVTYQASFDATHLASLVGYCIVVVGTSLVKVPELGVAHVLGHARFTST